jgi:AcrR family transcriptional regulator
MMNNAAASRRDRAEPEDARGALRGRLLKSAFTLFSERGFSRTSMLDIATHAKVSKRDLYAMFDNKQALLTDAIGERALGMRRLLGSTIPLPSSTTDLATTLVEIGTSILRTVCHPEVLTVYRLAIAESDRAPEIGRVLDSDGIEALRLALAEFITKAQARGLIGPGDASGLANRYAAVLFGDLLLLRLLLRVRDQPDAKEIEARARAATAAIMSL